MLLEIWGVIVMHYGGDVHVLVLYWGLGFDLKVDPILLRLCLALMLWFRPKDAPFYCGCALHLYFGFAQRATPFSLLAQRKWGKRKGTLNACFSSFRSDFPGGKKTDFSSKLEKLTLFLPENLPCIRASVKGNPLVLLSKFVSN